MDLLRLKEVLREKGITGKELSEAVGVTTNTISNIVSGKNFPNGKLLYDISVYLNVDVKELFNSTMDSEKESETIYINKDGKFVPVGKINK